MRKKQKQLSSISQGLIALTLVNIVAVLGQTTCNNGLGRVLYERLPNQQLQGFDDDVVRDTAPPFRVLEKCQDLCLRDRTASNNLVRACTSFDFQPGSRIASFSGSAEYEESTCYLTREQPAPEGIGILMLVPNSVHFTEVCLTSSRPERECPSRRYVFERHPRKKLKLPVSDIKEITAANRSDCEDKCLNEFSFVCRSANFDSNLRSCTMSRFTRRTHPELLEDDPNSDYLENTCLNAERRCDGLAVYVKEENKRLGGPFEVDIFNNMTLEECQTMCIRAEKYFCRSVEFDDQSKQCVLSEEDSISQKDDISISSSPTHHFYDLVCLDNRKYIREKRGNEYPDNSVTSHLFASGRRPDTAFQRYRNSRLGGEFHSEITGRSLSECLDECLRQTSFQCRSAVYSDRFRTCRLSRYNQRDGMRIIYDADYDYYENLMLNVVGGDGDDRDRPSTRPDGTGTDWRPPYSGDKDRNRDRFPDDRYPSRYPPSDGQMTYDKYPTGSRPDYGDRYPAGGERYPAGGERYPAGGERYPAGGERYPAGGERYPAGGERYPAGGDRYPAGGERYPAGGERYPAGGERYPAGGERYPAGGERYPAGGERYPVGGERYPGGSDRYPNERYPGGIGGDRYPGIGDEDRYPIIPDNRYPDDIRGGVGRPGIGRYPDDRYPVDDNDRGRYPARYPPSSRYPDDRDRYPGIPQPGIGGRYPIDDKYPVDDRDSDRGRYPGRYPVSRYPDELYPIDDSDRGRYPGASRYPPRYPDDGDYYTPSGRYPPDKDVSLGLPRPFPDDVRRPIGKPSSGRYPPDDRYPLDSRYPIDSRNPIDTRYPDRLRPTTSRLPIDMRYPIDSRYPDSRPGYSIPPDNRYPETRYPSPILSGGRYPVSENRFPVGNDRNPIYIYRYGNRERFPIGPGYDRYPMSAFDRDRDRDRGYGDRFGGGYGPPQESSFDRGVGRPFYGGYPPYEMPFRPPGSGYDNSLNAGTGDGFGAFGQVRPHGGSRCEDGDNFKQVGVRQKVRRQYVRRVVAVPSLIHCQRECIEAKDFACRSFNYRDSALSYDTDGGSTASRERETANCELSDRDTRELDIQNPQMFDAGTYDYYERSNSRNGVDGECLDVSQTCNEDGMEFTLRTPEGFLGRIYTYGFYDRCFFRGNGGTANVLRISGSQGYPECGTQRYGDTMTNIVVVQFSDNVQTGRDKRFNLTCIFRGPGEAVVTSGYIGAGSGSPIPIEYLPAENTLSSKVRLMILYQNRPTTTIAVGDPLTFRLEAQDGYNQLTDIFATNVVARDPYSGRSIQLIDRFGCPVDPYVFPELDKLRSGDSLEARFNAFKIPESNFLVFEATVRTCREGCQPAYCPGQSGRSEPSFGRRRRSINGTLVVESDAELDDTVLDKENSTIAENAVNGTDTSKDKAIFDPDTSPDIPEHVREMIEVFETRDEIDSDIVPRKLMSPLNSICLTPSEYHGLISAVILLMILLLSITLAAGLAYRRYWAVMIKNRSLDRSSPVNSFIPSALHQNMNVSTRQFNASTSGSSNQNMRPSLNLFNGSLQKTFATGNLSRMCQLPVMNPLRNNGNSTDFDDPSEPIYTDPSLFERSRVKHLLHHRHTMHQRTRS